MNRPTRLLALADVDAEFARIVDELTRRGFLAGGLGSAVALGLAACGPSGPSGDPSSGTPGPWSYTDDIGRTVRLDRAPKRIAVLSDLLASTLWSQGLRTIVAAPLYGGDEYLFAAGGVTAADRARMLPTSGSDGPDPEKLAKAAPDLVIVNTDSADAGAVAAVPALGKVAPWIAFNAQSASFEKIMASGARLLHAVGTEEVDLSAKDGYDAQAQRLRAALVAKPGLRIGFVFNADKDGVQIMSATQYPCTLTLGALGADLMKISGPNQYFQQFSWENVADLPLDLVVNTVGDGGAPDKSDYPWNQPTWQQMPAVRAGQYLNSGENWFVYNYATFTALLADLTDAVTTATAGIGPR